MNENKTTGTAASRAATRAETIAHLTSIIDNAPGFVYSIDRNFRLVTVNAILRETVHQHFGLILKPGDSPLTFFENIAPEFIEEWKNIYARAFRGEQLDFVKEFNIGEQSFWAFSINPIRENGNVNSVACFVRDVTRQVQSETKLRESEERYRIITQNPILGIAWGTCDGTVIRANKTFCDLLEGAPEEVSGLHFSKFTHPDDLPRELVLIDKLQKGEINNYRLEKRYITLKGNIRWVEVNISSSLNEIGEVNLGTCIIQDITEKKKAQEELLKSEANLRHIINSTDTAFLLLDKELKVLAANKLADEWAFSELGVHLIEGENFLTDNFPVKYKQWGKSILDNVLSGVPFQYESKYTTRNNSVNWYQVKLSPISDEMGRILGVSIAARETTRQKTAEDEIKQLNELLEKSMKERTAELEEVSKELEAFTYSISHDLMTPVRVIDGFVQVLLEELTGKLGDENEHALNAIKRNASQMDRLINDLLNFARFGRAPLVKQFTDMHKVVTQVIDELRFTTSKIDAQIKIKHLEPVSSDPLQIKQVWMNLISNGLKYSKCRTNPEIEIGSVKQNGKTTYYIKDNGVGFDMKQADKLFGVFQRLHHLNEFEGTGVGLAIVHRIITKHGGKVWAEARVNEGAIFYFTL